MSGQPSTTHPWVATYLDEVARLLDDLEPAERAEVQATVRRVVDKLLHTPTVRVKELADSTSGVSYAEALQELIGLDRTAPAAVAGTPLTQATS